ncbi:MAG TPA: DinB family protein [Streptosporangiaceae bacterium]|nr:DinB family protein [Streptosporangiaceae bacterium]
MADELVMLTGFLDYHRETLAVKCAGLTAAQLRERAVPPSALSLLGLVRHMAEVEQSWFQLVMNGQPVPYHWPREDAGASGESAEFDVTDADPGEAFGVWRAECARSRDFVAAAESLDVTGHYEGETFSLRYVLNHMIEEYARHNGHADLIRERIDGVTGD